MTDFDLWRIALACKMHFTGNYDAFKFNFKAKNLNPNAYRKCMHKQFYTTHARKLDNERDAKRFVFSNMFLDEKTFIRDMTMCPYETYNKRLQSLSYLFKKDLKRYDCKFDDILTARGDYPLILVDYMAGNVLPETVIVLHLLTNFLNRIQINDTLLWPELKVKLNKAAPFIKADIGNTKKFREIILGIYS